MVALRRRDSEKSPMSRKIPAASEPPYITTLLRVAILLSGDREYQGTSVYKHQFWEVRYKNGKGFVLIEGGQEIVRDV